MAGICKHCGQDCTPQENNSLGVEIQEYSDARGWVGITDPYASYCEAREALGVMSGGTAERRVYSALKPRLNAFPQLNK